MFKLGQRVWEIRNGWGKVTDTQFSDDYPINVEFGNGDVSYTADGKEYVDDARSLFFKEVIIPEDALVPPVEEIVLQQGDVVVFTNGNFGYVEAYSSSSSKVFFYHSKVPKNLEEAFGPVSVQKSLVKKVIGNINATV